MKVSFKKLRSYFDVVFYVVYPDKIEKYDNKVTMYEGKISCTCRGFEFRGNCKHLQMRKREYAGKGLSPESFQLVYDWLVDRFGLPPAKFSQEIKKMNASKEFPFACFEYNVDEGSCVFYFDIDEPDNRKPEPDTDS